MTLTSSTAKRSLLKSSRALKIRILLATLLFGAPVAMALGDSVDDDSDGYCDSTSCSDGSLPNDCNDDPSVQILNGVMYTGTDFYPGLNEGPETPYCGDGLDHDCDGSEGGDGGDDDADGLSYSEEISSFFFDPGSGVFPDCDPDLDDDNLSDYEELVFLATNAENDDSDSDSVRDDVEVGGDVGAPLDSDGDGNIDALDPDDDNDGVPTIEESPDGDGDPTNDNTDGDSLPNYRDEDDDGDGYPTIVEGGPDGDPTNDDTDADTIPDYLDEDSDGDTVLDADELDLNSDSSCDGSICQADDLPNRIDPDDDGDGIPTIDEDRNGDGDPTNDDFDGDNVPDYLDPDPIPGDVFKDGFENAVVTQVD